MFKGSAMTLWIVAAFATCSAGGLIVLPWLGLWRKGEPRHVVAREWRLGRLCLRIGLAAVTFLGTAVGYAYYLGGPARKARESAQADARALVPPPLLDDENAMVLMQQAAALLPAEADRPEWFRKSPENGELPWDEVASFVAAHQRALDLLAEAVTRPGFRLSFDADRPLSDLPQDEVSGYDELKPILQPLATLARVNAARLARDGQLGECWRQVEVLRALSQQIRSDPRTVIQILAGAPVDLRQAVIEKALSDHDFPSEEFPLPISCSPDNSRLALSTTIRWQNAQDLHWNYAVYLPEMLERVVPMPPHLVPFALAHMRVQRLADDLHAVPVISRRFELLADAPAETIRQERWELDEDIERRLLGLSPTVYLTFVQKSVALPLILRAMADQGLTELAMAAAGYRARHGRYPIALEELVPNYIDRLPIDPWDGQPLKMSVIPDGLILYSVGQDGIDDKGELFDLRKNGRYREHDQTFCLGAPYRERRNGKILRGW